MLRRASLFGVMLCCLLASAGCVAVQPKPDGTYSVSLLPPRAETTVSVTSSGPTSPSDNDSTPSNSSAANSIGKGTPDHPAYPGKSLKSGPWTVVVEKTYFAKQLEDGSKADKGKRFVLVDVAIRNAAVGAALDVMPNQFALWSQSNKVVDPYPTKLGMYNARSVRPIPAAMGGFTTFVYELPVNSIVYTFTITPKQGATGSMSWYVP